MPKMIMSSKLTPTASQLPRTSTVSHAPSPPPPPKHFAQRLTAIATALALTLSPAASVFAKERTVGSFDASGLVFKDKVEVVQFEDPDITGVSLYISDFKRSITDKLAKDFFDEPSQGSLTCVASGPVVVKPGKKVEDQRELLAESKSINLFQNRTLRVRRLFDPDQRVAIYIAYSTRLSGGHDGDGDHAGGRYRTSICSVALTPLAEQEGVVGGGGE